MKMKRLVHWMDLRKEDPSKIESPTLARGMVATLLATQKDLEGLDKLLKSCGVYSIRNVPQDCKVHILEKVRTGHWALIVDEPSNPVISQPSEYFSIPVNCPGAGNGPFGWFR